jgi:hypothetical protein
MKFKVFTFSFLFFFLISSSFAQRHKEICDLNVSKAITQEVLGRNIGIYVEFKNNNAIALDALEYVVNYFDGFNKKMGTKNFKWQAGNIIKAVEPGENLRDVNNNWVKGANKIQVIIIKAHFTNGKVCRR